tara:strand:+ start:1120 stop:1740 length:621 start_codon:yes stop_codon:yes gene_type:complete
MRISAGIPLLIHCESVEMLLVKLTVETQARLVLNEDVYLQRSARTCSALVRCSPYVSKSTIPQTKIARRLKSNSGGRNPSKTVQEKLRRTKKVSLNNHVNISLHANSSILDIISQRLHLAVHRQVFSGCQAQSKIDSLCTLTVPPNMYPSTNGKLCKCEYMIDIEADLPWAFDVNIQSKIVIALLPAPDMVSATMVHPSYVQSWQW